MIYHAPTITGQAININTQHIYGQRSQDASHHNLDVNFKFINKKIISHEDEIIFKKNVIQNVFRFYLVPIVQALLSMGQVQ